MPTEPISSAATNHPLRWIVVIYCVLALTAFAYPAGLRDWLEERDSGGRLWLPLAIARQIETASDAIGVKSVGVRLRAWFGRLIGDDES
jgi:hypothetical protein